MPPARTIIRGPNFTSVSDLTSTIRRDLLKPYDHSTITNKYFSVKKGKGKNVTNERQERNYMDLDEFLRKADNNDSSSDPGSRRDDVDYPKPTVDLLASLLTLGKMIQNQKQLIQNQSKQTLQSEGNATTDGTIDGTTECDITSLSSDNEKTNIDENSVNLSADNFVIDYENEKNQTSSISSKRCVIPEEIKDFDYWDRRKRNNVAAKKSREERRKKELEVVETTKQLETENSQLTLMLKRLTSRNEWLESRLQDIRRCKRSPESSLSSSAEEG